MQYHDDEFEWDEAKAESNFVRHGVAFDAAREVFRDPFALDWQDERENYPEPRYATIGMAEGRLLYVAYAMSKQRIRMISARGAEPYEQRRYHEENR